MNHTTDDLNPRFVYFSDVHFDELDPMKMLHNSRFAAHVERAITTWYAMKGKAWQPNPADNPDQFHVVRDLHIEYLNPVIGPGTMRIDVWLERLGTTSCVYGFLCSNESGSVAFARGERTIVKLDPASHKPAPWTDTFRATHRELLKDLPAYA
jgi:acyl-CoA thioester hydrolase